MKTMTGTLETGRLELAQLPGRCGQSVRVHGAVHSLRDMGGVTFLTLRKRDGVLQCVCGPGLEVPCEEAAVIVTGILREEARAPGGYELQTQSVQVLSTGVSAVCKNSGTPTSRLPLVSI